MATHRTRNARAAGDWFVAADHLFDEFPDRPLEDVVHALNVARREPGPDEAPPHVVLTRARELLQKAAS